MKKKIISAGHICLDITPIFPQDMLGKPIQDLLCPGKLTHMNGADIHTGGSVGNTGVALKLLGNDVRLMGKIGTDPLGSMLKSILLSYGAGGLIEDAKSATSYTVVVAVPGYDRFFLHDPGANDSFTGDDIPEEVLTDTALFHFGYPPLMKQMYADNGETLTTMFRRMKEHGIATSLDFASIDPNSPAGQADWRSILRKVLPYVDFFVPSFEELCFILDRERYDRLDQTGDMTGNLDLLTDVMPFAEELLQMGCRIVLIKCGTSGMLYRTADRDALENISPRIGLNPDAWADKSGIQPCFRADRVLSTTGAGDTSIAAFLTAALQGYSPEDCTALAAAEGACCVTSYDSLSAIRPIEELMRKIRAGWPVM